MNTMFPKLFERGKIGPVEVKNRIVKSPTQVAMRNPDGSVTDRMIKYYEEVARGGSGLIIVEGASVMPGPDGLGLSLAAPQYVPGLSFLAEVIQANGAKSVMQLLPGGGRSASWILPTPTKCPSRIPWEPWYLQGKPVPVEITVEEIHEIVDAFGNAAQRAGMAGFDMIEIHGGHGGLITNFLSPAQNKRNDLYGGTLYNRMRFLVEIVRDIRKKVSPDMPLLVRLSAIDYEPGGVVLEETIEVFKTREFPSTRPMVILWPENGTSLEEPSGMRT